MGLLRHRRRQGRQGCVEHVGSDGWKPSRFSIVRIPDITSARETKTSSPAESGTSARSAPFPKRRWNPNAWSPRPLSPRAARMRGSPKVRKRIAGRRPQRNDATDWAKYGREAWHVYPEPPHAQQPPRPWGKDGSAAWKPKPLAGRTTPQTRSAADTLRVRDRTDLANEVSQTRGRRVTSRRVTLRVTSLRLRRRTGVMSEAGRRRARRNPT